MTNQTQKAKDLAFEIVMKNPEIRESVAEALEIMIDEIKDGSPEDLEYERFLTAIDKLKFDIYLRDNSLTSWHSGGGMHHLAYDDETLGVLWLINHVDHDEEDGRVLPASEKDMVICSFDINNTADDTEDFKIQADVLSKIDVDGVEFDDTHTPLLWIRNKTLEDAVGLINQVSDSFFVNLTIARKLAQS